MTEISNDKSKYVRRGVDVPKREIENNKERDYEIDEDWNVKFNSPDVPSEEVKK